jgi:rod shape-determining protein MreD
MNNTALNNILRFIGLLLLQVLVLNHVNLFGFINPLLYIIFVLLYPIKKNKTALLLLSFILGLCIDFFSDSGGIHAAATLLIAYIRLPILTVILGKSDFDYLLFNIRSIAFLKAFTFIATLTFIHHFILFSLEYFTLNAVSDIIFNTFFTGIFTLILCILGIILFTKKK